ncbi:hypothetical protein VNO78_10700 [Psophocarpus tetragonolobus]|uniref:Uncharacterized protein n=1 Tax=Psophocarpus tetragonolobus TaxID=3891 RepID=A0AAN9SK58_PSOTE
MEWILRVLVDPTLMLKASYQALTVFSPFEDTVFSYHRDTWDPSSEPPSSKPSFMVYCFQIMTQEFGALPELVERVKQSLHYAAAMPQTVEFGRVEANRVMRCTARVWVAVRIDEEGSTHVWKRGQGIDPGRKRRRIEFRIAINPGCVSVSGLGPLSNRVVTLNLLRSPLIHFWLTLTAPFSVSFSSAFGSIVISSYYYFETYAAR